MSVLRRDFLAWLAAVPTVGCAAESLSSSSAPPADPIDPPIDPIADAAGAEEDELRRCTATTRDATGPYYEPGAPVKTRIASLSEPGVPLLVEGRLLGPDCKKPLAGYAIDVWQADSSGKYYAGSTTDYRLRGKIVTDALGRYRFETNLPGRYGDAAGIRPAHLHVRMLTPGGNELLTTQLYFAGDPFLGQADYCTRARTCNASDAKRALALVDALVSGRNGKRATFEAFLPRT